MSELKNCEDYLRSMYKQNDVVGNTSIVSSDIAHKTIQLVYYDLLAEIRKKDEIISIMAGNMQDGFLDYMSSKERKAYMSYFYGDDDD